jgi:hypothetical protein
MRPFDRTADRLAGATRLFEAGAGQCVHTFVIRVAGVSLDPAPFKPVTDSQRIEAAPQILIFHRLFDGSFPAAALPTMDPLTDAFLHILRIGIDTRADQLRERLQRLDHREQLHSVVRRGRLAAAQFCFDIAETQQGTPATGTRISTASTIRIDSIIRSLSS